MSIRSQGWGGKGVPSGGNSPYEGTEAGAAAQGRTVSGFDVLHLGCDSSEGRPDRAVWEAPVNLEVSRAGWVATEGWWT